MTKSAIRFTAVLLASGLTLEPAFSAGPFPIFKASSAAIDFFQTQAVSAPAVLAHSGVPSIAAAVRRMEAHPTPQGPLLQIQALAEGATRSGNHIIPGTAKHMLDDRFFHRIFPPGYHSIYLTGLLKVGDVVHRMERGERTGQDVGTPFYTQVDESGKTRAVIRQAWSGDQEAVGSAFSASDSMDVNPAWGTLSDLMQLRDKLRGNGHPSTYMDVVPNHVGVDSPWLEKNWDATVFIPLPDLLAPALLSRLSDQDFFNPDRLRELGVYGLLEHALAQRNMSLQPQALHFYVFYTCPGDPTSRILIAHGRDPWQVPWVNSAQLNYLHPKARAYVMEDLEFFASRGINARIDMAQLVLRISFKELWCPQMSWDEFDRRWPREFWEEVRDTLLKKYPDFHLMMEAYGDEAIDYLKTLHPRIRVYEKRLRDLIERRDFDGIRNYLIGAAHSASVYFIQNHDDSAMWHLGKEFVKTAMVCMGFLPGTLLVHYRQTVGLDRFSIQRLLDPPGHSSQPDFDLDAFHAHLAILASQPLVQEGDFYLVHPTNPNVIAYGRRHGHQRMLVIVNLSDQAQQGTVPLPPHWSIDEKVVYPVDDWHFEHKAGWQRERQSVKRQYLFSGQQILEGGGIYVDLYPHDAHVFLFDDPVQVLKDLLKTGA